MHICEARSMECLIPQMKTSFVMAAIVCNVGKKQPSCRTRSFAEECAKNMANERGTPLSAAAMITCPRAHRLHATCTACLIIEITRYKNIIYVIMVMRPHYHYIQQGPGSGDFLARITSRAPLLRRHSACRIRQVPRPGDWFDGSHQWMMGDGTRHFGTPIPPDLV